jgi:hypothetical protein
LSNPPLETKPAKQKQNWLKTIWSIENLNVCSVTCGAKSAPRLWIGNIHYFF